MTKAFWNVLKLSPVIIAATFIAANSAFAAESNQENSLGQVTSVSQFSDVQPTDWAFQSLQSLVERYGCIAGYPNGTFRGNRALTRYEFAAGLNACLNRVNELLATATADLVTKDDLASLQRLQEEFSAELATLRGRVDALEARTDELEAKQFSTTTKLAGEAIINVSEAFGKTKVGGDNLDASLAMSDRIRLNLNTSFDGKDRLNIRLNANNTVSNNGGTTNAFTGTDMTRLSFDGSSSTNNNLSIDKVNYAFALNDKVRVKVDAIGGEFYGNVDNFNPALSSDGRGSISRYGRFSPIYRQGQGGAGATITFTPSDRLTASVGYLAGTSDNPASSPAIGAGLTNGSFAALGQVGYKFNDAFSFGLTYARAYQETPSGKVNLFQSTGSKLANAPFGSVDTAANHYGVEATFKPNSKLTLAGWYGFTNAEAKSGANAGSEASMNYWATSLAVQDFGKEGNVLGFIFGQSPKVTGSDIKVAGVEQKDKDTSYHLEALYRMQVTDNISVTPGLMVIFNPEHNDANDTIYVGTLRTTFTF